MDQNEETEPNEETDDIYKELDPREVAGDFMHELVNLCSFECMPKPDEEDVLCRVLDYCYSRCDIDPEVDVAIKKSKTFRDELEKELREMLNDFWAKTISAGLTIELDKIYDEIVNNEYLVNFRKARLLKKYQKVLEEFADAIDRALKEKKPLSKKDLYNWFMEIGDTVLGTEAYDWFDPEVDNWLSFYDSLNDNYKLVMLWILEDVIRYNVNSLLHRIKEKLSELEGLKNER